MQTTPCKPSPVLVAKYNAPASQTVVTVSDNVLPLQVFFNKARGNKPQNFKSQDTDPVDPTNNGANWCARRSTFFRHLRSNDTSTATCIAKEI